MIKNFFTNITAFLFYLISGFIFLSIIANVSSDEKEKAIEKDNIRSVIKSAEFRYRDELTRSFQDHINGSSLKKIDSLSILEKDYYSIKQFLIQNFLLKQKEKIFYTYSTKQPFLFVSYDSIKTIFSIKSEDLSDLEKNFNSKDATYDLLRYGNIIETKSHIKAKVNYDILALVIGALLILKFIVDFIFGLFKSRKEKNSYQQFQADSNAIQKTIKNVEENGKISGDTIDYLKDKIKELRGRIDHLTENSTTLEDAKLESLKLEKITRQFYERSNLLLVIAFIIAIIGITIFYLILPEFKSGGSLNEYLAISLRPVLTLVFFQTLSFFIFKQYRISVSDYKFFNKVYQENNAFITAHKLLKAENLNEIQLASIKKFMHLIENDQKEVEQSNEDSILQQIKAILKRD